MTSIIHQAVLDRFTLEEQIQHKKDFCQQYLPKEGKLFVISHSIGCYMSLRYVWTDWHNWPWT